MAEQTFPRLTINRHCRRHITVRAWRPQPVRHIADGLHCLEQLAATLVSGTSHGRSSAADYPRPSTGPCRECLLAPTNGDSHCAAISLAVEPSDPAVLQEVALVQLGSRAIPRPRSCADWTGPSGAPGAQSYEGQAALRFGCHGLRMVNLAWPPGEVENGLDELTPQEVPRR
jgi:hypothetical protein